MVEPIAFLVVSKEDVKLLVIKGKGVISQLTEMIPEIMEKYKSSKGERKKEESPAVWWRRNWFMSHNSRTALSISPP